MQKPRVLISRQIPQEAITLLEQSCELELNPSERPLSKLTLIRRLKGCSGLVCLLTDDQIDDAVLSVPGLRIVSNVAVGYNNIDLASATRRGVLVTNTPGVLTETTADFAWALMMAASRRVGEGERLVRAGRFKGWGIMTLLGRDMHGKTLGLVGFGRIGQAVARRALGFGMKVLYTESQPVPAELDQELRAEGAPLERLLRESDFVSLHVPLLPETRHLIDDKAFSLMKPTAVLVNTSRGPVIDEGALVRALKDGRIFAAGLDVYEDEPDLAPGLARLENVVLAPHIASASVETRTRMAVLAAENMLAGLSGKRPPSLVNPEAWKG